MGTTKEILKIIQKHQSSAYGPSSEEMIVVDSENFLALSVDIGKLFNQQTTSQQQTIERLREELRKTINALDKYEQLGRYEALKIIKEAGHVHNTTEASGNYYCTEVYKNGFYCEEQCERCKKVDPLTEPIDQ